MEISDTFGDKIVIDTFNKEQSINNQKIIRLMSTTINNHGDGNVINTGDNANIEASITIAQGDKEQLNKQLRTLGIDAADIEEINKIVDIEIPVEQSTTLGDSTIDWITKVSGKALKGVGSITKEVTSSLLANILMQYFGIAPTG